MKYNLEYKSLNLITMIHILIFRFQIEVMYQKLHSVKFLRITVKKERTRKSIHAPWDILHFPNKIMIIDNGCIKFQKPINHFCIKTILAKTQCKNILFV